MSNQMAVRTVHDLPLTATAEQIPARPLGSLAAALAAARDKCKTAPKGGVNTFHRYRYASADDVIATATEALTGSSLGLIPVNEELIVLGSGATVCWALNRTLLLAHSSGEHVLLETRGWPVVPERGRPLDKAYAIALTTSLSYKLRDLLQMPRGDVTDDVAAQQDQHTPVQSPPRAEDAVPPPSTDPTPPASLAEPSAGRQETAEITEDEYTGLVALARAHKRTTSEVSLLCKVMGIPVFHRERILRQRLNWLKEALTWGLAPIAQVDRISGLAQQLRINPEALSHRLLEKFGVTSLAHLLPREADQVEQGLRSRLQPQGAA